MDMKLKKETTNGTNVLFVEQIETLKKEMERASIVAKENIWSVIASCTTNYGKAIESNKKYVDELREQLKKHNIDINFFEETSSDLFSSLDVLDDVIDAIIDSHILRTNRISEYYKKSLEAIERLDAKEDVHYENLITLFKKNFNQSLEHSTKDIEKISDIYSSHLNLTINFNKNFCKNIINAQIEAISKIKSNNIGSEWLVNWWDLKPGEQTNH